MNIKLLCFASLSATVLFFSAGCGNAASSGTAGTTTTTDSTNNKTPALPMVVASVNFGNPPAGGGPCSGNGICDAVTTNQAAVKGTQGAGIPDTFQVSATNKNVLTMRFSMAALRAGSQASQLPNFTNQAGTYTFSGPYDLTNPIFAPLGLAPNAKIDPTCKSTVAITGDLVTVSITYLHS